jgi:phytoene synthase
MRLISRAGKTFYFATLWLEKQIRRNAALAYAFCRTVDDIADGDMSLAERDTQLRDIGRAVLLGDTDHDLVRPLAPLLTQYPETREPFAALVDACREDGPSLTITSEEDLIRYAHGVAGNVGLIMYPILGGQASIGQSSAADLGIAMQCTNIARDVFEDLARERVYLPLGWLRGRDLRELLDLASDSNSEAVVVAAVKRLLLLADDRYARGLSGLQYLAPENRFAIKVAARCYAAIGERVILNGRLARERAVVPLARKVILACSIKLFGGHKLHWKTVTCEP